MADRSCCRRVDDCYSSVTAREYLVPYRRRLLEYLQSRYLLGYQWQQTASNCFIAACGLEITGRGSILLHVGRPIVPLLTMIDLH